MPLATGKENIGSGSAATTTKKAGGVGPRSGNKSPNSRPTTRPGCSLPSPGLGRTTPIATADRSMSIAASFSTPTADGVGASVRGSKKISRSHGVAPRVFSTPVAGADAVTPASRNQGGRGALPKVMPEGLGKRSAKKVLLSTPVMEPSGRTTSRKKRESKTGHGGTRSGALDAKQRAAMKANQCRGKEKVKPKVSGVTRESWKQRPPLEGDPPEVFSFDMEPEDDDQSAQWQTRRDLEQGSEGERHRLLRSVPANGSQASGRHSSPNTDSQGKKKGTVFKKGGVFEDIGGRRVAHTKKRKGNDGAVATTARYAPKRGDGPRRSLAVLPAADTPLTASPIKSDSSIARLESSRGWAQLRELFGDLDEEDERKSRDAALWRLSDDEDSNLDLETETRSRICSRRKSLGTTGGGAATAGTDIVSSGGRSRARDGRRRSTGGLSGEDTKLEKSVKGWGGVLPGRRAAAADDRDNDAGGSDGAMSTLSHSEARAASPSEREANATGGRGDWRRMSKTDEEKLKALAVHYKEVDSFPLIVSSQRKFPPRI